VAVVLGVVALLHGYLYWRLLARGELAPSAEVAGAVALASLAAAMPIGIALGRLLPAPASRVAAALAYGWMGLAWLLFSLTVASEPLRLVLAPFWGEPLTSRRLALGIVVLGIGLASTGVARALAVPRVRRVRVAIDGWPVALAGYRIAQLSDVHLGPLLGKRWLAGVVARVNAAAPDLVAITGDLCDGSVRRLRDDVAPLAELRPRHGVYFVTGNHEYYSGADAWLAELAALGARALRNARVRIGEGDAAFELAGVDDWSAFGPGHGPDLARALAGRDPRLPVVLLAHQPLQVREAAQARVDLQLSGHTHGGQIFPWHLFVRLQQPVNAGLVRRGRTQLYVSRGTGFWGPPMRVFAPPEITLLEITPAARELG
jgi:predicted MPP superfamily phosphohydrolase